MKIKWNWGTGIFLTIVAMLSFLAFMVNKTLDYKINKVSEDYYERGLNHSEHMQKVKNSLSYQEQFDVIHTDVCTVHFPDFFSGKEMNGRVLFFRPSDYTKDTTFTIVTDTNNNQVISLEYFLKGKYIVRAEFECEGTDYFLEKEIKF